MAYSNVTRISAGAVNTVNDAAIGQSAAQGFGPSTTKFAGQLGAIFEWRDAEVLYDSSVGTVYGGGFQYVKMSPSAGAVVAGQLVYWDPSADLADYQVTTVGTLPTVDATQVAGVALNPDWEAGNYSFIQIYGLVDMLAKGTITGTAATGAGVYASAAGDGTFDVLDAAVTAAALARYLGVAWELPVAGHTSLVFLQPRNIRR